MRQQSSWPRQAWHDLGSALQLAHEAIENDPGYQRAWTLLADIYHRIGDQEFAEKSLKKSYSLATPGPHFPGRFYKSVKGNIVSGYPFNAAGNLRREAVPAWFTEKYQRYFVLDPVIWASTLRSEPDSTPERDSLKPSSIFISYSRVDWDTYAKPLVERLQAAGLAVWVDQLLIEGGQNWFDEIVNALKTCKRMIVCVSPDALASRHVKMEYRHFFNNDKKLFVLICRQAELPPPLSDIQFYSYDQLDSLLELLKRDE